MKTSSLCLCLLMAGLSVNQASAAFSASFSGGNGTPVVITLNEPITYTVTMAGVGPIFVFDSAGPAFAPFSVGATGLTYSVNEETPVTISIMSGGSAIGDMTPDDWFVYNPGIVSAPLLQVGDTVTLHAGTFTTLDPYENSVPSATGSFNSYIVNGSGITMGSAIPEPSVLLFSAVLPGLLCLRRKRS